jgi:2-polyprenyl-3-methyl-5-hydroxy-6-metoxy-1,4-benzoquinol methylase
MDERTGKTEGCSHAVIARNLLGANAVAYAQTEQVDGGLQDWEWCRRKRGAIVVAVQRALGSRTVRKLLDVGCRNGAESAFYGQSLAAGETHGFEIAEQPLAEAARRGVHGHVWVSGEGPSPIPDGFFDVIVAADIIEHIFDTDVFLNELSRIMSADGVLVVTTPNLGWWRSRLRFLRGGLPSGIGGASFRHSMDNGVDIKHVRVSIPSEWAHLFRAHGLLIIQIVGFNYPRHLRSPLWLIDDILTKCVPLAHSSLFVLKKAI